MQREPAHPGEALPAHHHVAGFPDPVVGEAVAEPCLQQGGAAVDLAQLAEALVSALVLGLPPRSGRVGGVLEVDRARRKAEAHARAERERPEHSLYAVRLEDVVGAEELDVAAAGEGERPVEVPIDAEIPGVCVQAHARVLERQHAYTRDRTVGRVVVDDHHLEVAVRLSERGADRGLDPVLGLVGGNAHRYLGGVLHPQLWSRVLHLGKKRHDVSFPSRAWLLGCGSERCRERGTRGDAR